MTGYEMRRISRGEILYFVQNDGSDLVFKQLTKWDVSFVGFWFFCG